jgi:hypothetical protein
VQGFGGLGEGAGLGDGDEGGEILGVHGRIPIWNGLDENDSLELLITRS